MVYHVSFIARKIMKVYGLLIPDGKGLTNIDIYKYVRELRIPHFRGVFMRDTLPSILYFKECGIVNFNTSKEPGSRWICYFKNDKKRIYFDSYGQVMLAEVRHYLKIAKQLKIDLTYD